MKTKKSPVNSPLRAAYEEILGKTVSDRTWQRVRNDLLIFGVDVHPGEYEIVRGAALIRRSDAIAPINRNKAIAVSRLIGHFYNDVSDRGSRCFLGSDIRDAIFNCFSPHPSIETLRQWGLLMTKTYSQDDTLTFLAKLLMSKRFKIKPSQDIPRVGLAQLLSA